MQNFCCSNALLEDYFDCLFRMTLVASMTVVADTENQTLGIPASGVRRKTVNTTGLTEIVS